jgi:putative flavoprotein involved in K+ transport
MTRLPGLSYDGPDPDGFMSVPQLVDWFERYAATSAAPLLTDTTVRSVEQAGDRFRVVTDRGTWSADSVVVATGYCDRPALPPLSRDVPASVAQLVPSDYRRPGNLPDGGVLVVGASSTGVQLADEIQRSGRQVTLAVGRHIRLPRRYRGQDVFRWFDRLGLLSTEADAVRAFRAARKQPSLQLVGRSDHTSLDLATLHDLGVRIVGRAEAIDSRGVTLADDLIATTAAADIKMAELRLRIDAHISDHGLDAGEPEPFRPTWPLARTAPERLHLAAERIHTIIWATGYRRTYPWLRVPVLDPRGEIVHAGGVTPVPGLYVLGMQFQRRRNSSFIDGVGDDACAIAEHIVHALGTAQVA